MKLFLICVLLAPILVTARPREQTGREFRYPGGPEKEPKYDSRYAYAPRVSNKDKLNTHNRPNKGKPLSNADEVLFEDELLFPAVTWKTWKKAAKEMPMADEWRPQGDQPQPQSKDGPTGTKPEQAKPKETKPEQKKLTAGRTETKPGEKNQGATRDGKDDDGNDASPKWKDPRPVDQGKSTTKSPIGNIIGPDESDGSGESITPDPTDEYYIGPDPTESNGDNTGPDPPGPDPTDENGDNIPPHPPGPSPTDGNGDNSGPDPTDASGKTTDLAGPDPTDGNGDKTGPDPPGPDPTDGDSTGPVVEEGSGDIEGTDRPTEEPEITGDLGSSEEPGVDGFEKDCKIDLVFLIDATNSMSYENFLKIKIYMKKTIDSIPKVGPDDVQVGVLLLSDEIDTGTVIPLNMFKTKAELVKAMMDDFIVPFSDRATLLGLAMSVLRTEMLTEKMGARPSVKNKVAVIMTDGWTYDEDDNQVFDEAVLLRGMGVTIVTLGIAPEPYPINTELLRGIADEGYYSEMSESHYDWINKINAKSCKDPEGPSFDDCSSNLDIVFLMDASGSMSAVNFTRQQHFISDVVEDLEIGADGVRVASVVFSADDSRYTHPVFYLDDYTKKEDVIQAVYNITYYGYSTYLARALQITREEVLIPERGSRKTTPKVVVVITDGIADDREYIKDEVDKLKADHPFIEIIAIGVGQWLQYGGHEELDKLTGDDDTKVFEVKNFPEIFGYVNKLKRTICRLQARGEALQSSAKEITYKLFA